MPAWSAGEPHLHTLDGYSYDFQGAGEFVLVRARTDDLEIQARQEAVTDRVTVNTAVGVRIDGAVVEVNEQQVVVNTRASPRGQFTSYQTPGGGEVRAVGGGIRFEWKDGSRMSFVGTTVALRLDDRDAARSRVCSATSTATAATISSTRTARTFSPTMVSRSTSSTTRSRIHGASGAKRRCSPTVPAGRPRRTRDATSPLRVRPPVASTPR